MLGGDRVEVVGWRWVERVAGCGLGVEEDEGSGIQRVTDWYLLVLLGKLIRY